MSGGGGSTVFQFLMVQLKVEKVAANVSLDRISIPYGSIKSLTVWRVQKVI